MPMQFDMMKVPENIAEAAADNSNAKHIYRNYLKGRMVEEWMNMCDDARNRIAPQQFYFRYLMRDSSNGPRHPDDNLSPENAHLGFGDMNEGFNGRKKRVTKNWTLNVSAAFFDDVGATVLANDWTVATWIDIYDRCMGEAMTFEGSNGFFIDFKKTYHYPKFVEAKLMSIYERNKSSMWMALGLSQRQHSHIINHQAFPIALKYAMVSAYLISIGHPHGNGMRNYAKSYFSVIEKRAHMPMTYDQFFDRLADY